MQHDGLSGITENNSDENFHANTNKEIEQTVEDVSMAQYLTFFIDNEEYGIDILSVKEIRGWEPATAIPNAPTHLKGVINLRGTVVPITDLRLRFGVKKFEYSPTTVVIIVKVKLLEDSVEKIMGIVVDAVSDVSDFADSDVQATPELASNRHSAFIKGLGSRQDKMVILLDINELLSAPDDADFAEMSRAYRVR